MKKKTVLMILCCMVLWLTACAPSEKKESKPQADTPSVSETGQTIEIEESSQDSQGASEGESLTEEQALEAIKKYCYENNPDLKDMEGSDEQTLYWEVSTNDTGERVVLYRSYTGAQIRYYIDPVSGDTYVTELVPGIIDDEQRTEESFNVRDYL
ncbi:MAG: hypothetical protein IIZ75_01210 [Lachnospiraceae bacterium]|nr:hypothetical protein [Lachnospiraceae bacterium]